MGLYGDYQLARMPGWLAGTYGQGWSIASGLMKDSWASAATQAATVRYVSTAPDDALPYIGEERGLPRNPGETLPNYRARLLTAWDLWQYAGTETGIVTALHSLGFSNVWIMENSDWAYPPGPGYSPGDEWWRFWVIIGDPHGFGPPLWRVGDGSTVGGGQLLGFQWTPAGYTMARPTILRWKPAHAVLCGILICLSGRIVGDGWEIGDGTLVGGDVITI